MRSRRHLPAESRRDAFAMHSHCFTPTSLRQRRHRHAMPVCRATSQRAIATVFRRVILLR